MKLNVGTIILRFYVLMALVLIGGFSGNWWIALFALPVLLSAMLGVKISLNIKGLQGSGVKETQRNITNSKAV